MAPKYQLVGVNEESLFPPEVEERLHRDFDYEPTEIEFDSAIKSVLNAPDSETNADLNARYQAKGTVDDAPVSQRLRGNTGSLHSPVNNPTQVELMRQLSHREMNNISIRQGTRTDGDGVQYWYTEVRQESYGQRLPGAVRHEYAGNFQTSWIPGTPGIPTVEDITQLAHRKKSRIVASGSGISQSGGDIGQIAGASWRDGIKYQGMSLSHQKHMECIGFDANGIARVYSMIDGQTDADMAADGVQDAWGFGPYLVKNGVPRNLLAVPQWNASDAWMTMRSARMLLGQSSNGSNIMVAVEGISSDYGIRGQELVNLAQAVGMYNAVALDGGGSTQILADFKRVHPSSDANGTRLHGDFVVFNGPIMRDSVTLWRDAVITRPDVSGVLRWRVVDGDTLQVQANLSGDFPEGVFSIATGAIPRGYRPRNSQAVRGPAYLTSGHMGLAHVLTSGDIGFANRSGATRDTLLANFSGPLD